LSTSEQVLSESSKLFDAAGIVVVDGDSILIVGLETSSERDLDDFVRDEKRSFIIRGFEIHFQPLLDSMMDFIRGLGLSVGMVGHCGYPQGDELNLKRLAVAAGLGSWGKNAMLLHPHFGPRLRLAALRITGTALDETGPGLDAFELSQSCRECNACVDVCPVGVLEPYYLWDTRACRASTAWSPDPGKVECCDLCWKVCPVGSSTRPI
jgi:ferredoxin